MSESAPAAEGSGSTATTDTAQASANDPVVVALEPTPNPKNKILAALLGLVAPGLGQVFVGYPLRGLVWAIVPFVLIVLFLVLSTEPSPGTVVMVIAACVFVAYVGAIVDVLLIPSRKHRPTPVPLMILFGMVAFIAAPILAVLTRAFIVEAFKVPSGAMIPTITIGDHLFADKLVYRKRAVRRGEVIIFKYPEHPQQDFVKRVIAISGDKLEVRKGHPVINGWEVPSCFVGRYRYNDPADLDPPMHHEGELFVEFLEHSAYLILLDNQGLSADYQGPFIAKDGESWVLGDNRNNSHDSRMWFGGVGGGVPASHVKARARVIWLSLNSSHQGHDLANDPAAPSPELAAPLAKCLAERPTLERSTPPPPAK